MVFFENGSHKKWPFSYTAKIVLLQLSNQTNNTKRKGIASLHPRLLMLQTNNALASLRRQSFGMGIQGRPAESIYDCVFCEDSHRTLVYIKNGV